MRKKLAVLLAMIFLVLLAFWSPWLYLKLDLVQFFGVSKPENIAGLQVYSLAGELEVYLDGELLGSAGADKAPLILDRVEPRDYLITLKRSTDVRGSYWDFNQLISFVSGTTVIISYNLGPEEEFSEGHIIYASVKDNQNDKSKLNIDTNIDDPEIYVEDLFIQKLNSKQVSSELSFDKPRKVTIKKTGYESLEFTILPESQSERDLLSKYNLNIDAHLMLQPVMVE